MFFVQFFSNFVIFFCKTQYVVSSKNLQSIISAVIMCASTATKHSAQRNVQRTAQYKAHSATYSAQRSTKRTAQYKAHSATYSAQRSTKRTAQRTAHSA